MELHLAMQCRGIHQSMLCRQVDASSVLPQDPRQIVLLRAAEVLLERHLVIVTCLPTVAVAGLPTDARVPRQVDLPDHRPTGPENGTLDDVAQLADVSGPGVAHELRQRLVGKTVDALLARHLAVA